MYQSEYSLILYPIEASFSVSQQTLISELENIDLLGKQESVGRYLVGERFLSLFCFMGCSPDIELFPQDNDNDKAYCYIEVPEPFAEIQCIVSKNAKAPRCPHCKIDLIQLPSLLAEHCDLSTTCPSCSNHIFPAKLNWRKTAIFAKSYITIANIYEAEAIPDQSLLDELERFTNVSWKYAYIRS